jgi:RNA polymerase sigma-70 factor (ECF subfamily)
MIGRAEPERLSALPELDQFIEDISPDLLAYFARRVSIREDAADCVSDTLLAVWRNRSQMPESADARRAWSFGVATGVLKNNHRSGLRQSALADRLRDEIRTRPSAMDPPAIDELAHALEMLKPSDKELVTLVAWEGFTLVEAASILAIRPDAARARYSRARRHLMHSLSH